MIRRSVFLAVAAALMAAALCLAGCGGGDGADTPKQVAEKAVDAARSANAAEGQAYFARPEIYELLAALLPPGAAATVGEAHEQDPANATVDVILGVSQQAGAPRIVLLMSNTGTGWKIYDVISQ